MAPIYFQHVMSEYAKR